MQDLLEPMSKNESAYVTGFWEKPIQTAHWKLRDNPF